MEHFGAFIAEGAEDWQIFQRRNKTAEVRLTGTWKPSPQMVTGEGTVYVRAVLEDTGEEVLSWQKAEQQESRNQPDLVVTDSGQKRIGKHKWFCVLELPEGGLYRIETCLMENGRPAGCLAEARRGDIRSHGMENIPYIMEGKGNRVLLVPQKRVSGSVFINGGSEANPSMHPPYDEETGLPVLAFWHMAVKAKT